MRTFSRRELLARAAAGAGVLPLATLTAAPPVKRRPNIVMILSDDQGYGDLGCYGAKDLRTPVTDRLADQGVRFTQYYAAAPECSPTRTALLTGRYLQRVGGLECAIGVGNVGRYDDAIRLAGRHDLGLPSDLATLPRALKAAGYATAVYGKWHLGYEEKFRPSRCGFDQFVGVLGGNCDYFHHCENDGLHVLYENDKPLHREGTYLTDLIADQAVGFLKRQKGDMPFFLYVPFTAPHSPYQGPGDRRPQRLGEQEWEKGTRAKYVEMVERLDACVGRILAAVEATGQADNTLVIFASDNGGNKMGSNVPFAGHKSGLYEGGIRVPCIVRWPGVLPAGRTSSQPSITMDLTASMLAAAGATAPPELPLEGMDILGHVRRAAADRARTLFWRARRGQRTWRAVRDGNLKYLTRQDGDKIEQHLFDLAADPAEKTDLLAARPADADRLRSLLTKWEQEVKPRR